MSSYESHTIRIDPEPSGLCALIQDSLPFYLEGDVSPQSRRFIDAHLAECAGCSAFLAGGRSVRSHLRREQTVRATPAQSLDHTRLALAHGRRQIIMLVLATLGMVGLLLAIALAAGGSSASVPAPEFARNRSGAAVDRQDEPPFAPTSLPEPTPTPVPAQP